MVLAGYDLSACAVPLQGLAPESPGSTSVASAAGRRLIHCVPVTSPWMSLELPPLQYMLFPLAGVFGPGADVRSCRHGLDEA